MMNYTETEKRYISIIESNLKHFNTGRRKRLTIEYYISDGNRARVLWGDVCIAEYLSIENAHCFIWGFTSGRERK